MSRKQEILDLCQETQKHLLNRMCDLSLQDKTMEALAVYQEIKEWLVEKEKSKILTLKRVSKT